MFTSPLQNIAPDAIKPTVLKLHKQYIHPSAHKLKKLIRDSGINDQNILSEVDRVTDNCVTCKKFKVTPQRPVVSFPLANSLNEVVAMDLKFFDTFIILHTIDHVTRYSQASIIPNKLKRSIVKGLFNHWICIFGTPEKFLSDNSGEFVNDEFIELAEKFNIRILTTAAEDPWSNGLCERHNAILSDLTRKVQMYANRDIHMALRWAVAAKTSMTNIHGFTPNQLVFGRNLNLPCVSTDKLPAENNSDTSEYMAQTLQALHSARQAFIQH